MNELLNNHQMKFQDIYDKILYFKTECENLTKENKLLNYDLEAEKKRIQDFQKNKPSGIIYKPVYQDFSQEIGNQKHHMYEKQHELIQVKKESQIYKDNCDQLSQRIEKLEQIFNEIDSKSNLKQYNVDYLKQKIDKVFSLYQFESKIQEIHQEIEQKVMSLKKKEDILSELTHNDNDSLETFKTLQNEYRQQLKKQSKLDKTMDQEKKSFKKQQEEDNTLSYRLNIISNQYSHNFNKIMSLEQKQGEIEQLERQNVQLVKENSQLEKEYKKVSGTSLNKIYKIEIKKVVDKVGPQNINAVYQEESVQSQEHKVEEIFNQINQKIIENNKKIKEIDNKEQELRDLKIEKQSEAQKLSYLVKELNEQIQITN